MSQGLLTIAQAAASLGCRDRRTARKRLALIGCPELRFGSRVYVDPVELSRALRAHAVAPRLRHGVRGPAGAGVVLGAGERLWDDTASRA